MDIHTASFLKSKRKTGARTGAKLELEIAIRKHRYSKIMKR